MNSLYLIQCAVRPFGCRFNKMLDYTMPQNSPQGVLGNVLCPETHLAPRIWDVALWACGCYDPAAGVFNDHVPWGGVYS